MNHVSTEQFADYARLVRNNDTDALRHQPDAVLANVLVFADVGLFAVGERFRDLAALEGAIDE